MAADIQDVALAIATLEIKVATQVGLSLICSKIYLLFLPELLKFLPIILLLFSLHHQLFLFYSIVSVITSQCRSDYI